jgi:small subunit ribosomal protein S4
MSRYSGPRVKVMRALGLNLPGLSRKSIERRPYPPASMVAIAAAKSRTTGAS